MLTELATIEEPGNGRKTTETIKEWEALVVFAGRTTADILSVGQNTMQSVETGTVRIDMTGRDMTLMAETPNTMTRVDATSMVDTDRGQQWDPTL